MLLSCLGGKTRQASIANRIPPVFVTTKTAASELAKAIVRRLQSAGYAAFWSAAAFAYTYLAAYRKN